MQHFCTWQLVHEPRVLLMMMTKGRWLKVWLLKPRRSTSKRERGPQSPQGTSPAKQTQSALHRLSARCRSSSQTSSSSCLPQHRNNTSARSHNPQSNTLVNTIHARVLEATTDTESIAQRTICRGCGGRVAVDTGEQKCPAECDAAGLSMSAGAAAREETHR